MSNPSPSPGLQPSSSSASSSSPQPPPPPQPSSSRTPYYSFQSRPPHTDPTFVPSPQEPQLPPPPPDDPSAGPSLREPPAPDILPPERPTLAQFRASEGPEARAAKLRALWHSLPSLPDVGPGPTATQRMRLPGQDTRTALSPERAERLRRLYEEELVRRCAEERPQARLWGGADDVQPGQSPGGPDGQAPEGTPTEDGSVRGVREKGISWTQFRRFLWDQERELWDIFQELDKNGDGRLDASEMRAALSRSGIDITPATVDDLVRFLAHASPATQPKSRWTSGVHSKEDMYVTFREFRDFLIMLPRRATPFEIYKYYQVKKRFVDGRGAARVDKEGDFSGSFPKTHAEQKGADQATLFPGGTREKHELAPDEVSDDDDFADDVEGVQEDRHEAWRFLLAGGIAGAVSRTVTAPFDRLKIYLITTDNTYVNASAISARGLRNPFRVGSTAVNNLWGAVVRIYGDGGGLKAFWVGNGLNVMKIFPESAIKFVSYEQSKKFLAQYWDRCADASELSSSSRFLAGGIGGITSQFAIYGLETLKTRIQSDVGPAQGMRAVVRTAADMWRTGGIRAYYRGLTLGLVGVFPYSAIDMGTYETLKRAYCKSTGKDEPSVFATLSFGALSGSIGAASVYPVNLLRTRLQASGSSGHRHAYTGFRDVLHHTLAHEGWRGLYKGLLPSTLKVGPAVGVSWIVYEEAKRKLGV